MGAYQIIHKPGCCPSSIQAIISKGRVKLLRAYAALIICFTRKEARVYLLNFMLLYYFL